MIAAIKYLNFKRRRGTMSCTSTENPKTSNVIIGNGDPPITVLYKMIPTYRNDEGRIRVPTMSRITINFIKQQQMPPSPTLKRYSML